MTTRCYDGQIRALVLFFAVAAVALFPVAAFAQGNLFISPASGSYKIGELFSVLVNVNTGGASINAASGLINFDNSRLEITDVGFSRSIFTLWTEEPKFSNAAGTVRFSGGMPSPGFTGASGNILRIVFRPKSAGQAAVVFSSGSILANDGQGTNILDSFRGGIYGIIELTKPQLKKTEQPVAPVADTSAEKTVSAPVITEWPAQLEQGNTLAIKGLAFPQSRILVFFQKGSGDAVVEETFSGADGRFVKTYSKTVSSGFYRVWAKNVGLNDMPGPASETITVEVIQPLFFRIGTVALNYFSIIVTLFALVIFLMLLLLFVWVRVRKWREAQGKEIAEAEKVLHRSFDTLRDGLSAYLSYIFASGSRQDRKHREESTRHELKKELEDLESGIEKEIDDIKRTGKKR